MFLKLFPLASLAPHKEQWYELIDPIVERIGEALVVDSVE